MDLTITPGRLSGNLTAIPSKSQAHRLLICAAFADGPTTLICPEINRDIEATADCLRALGADIRRTADGFDITPAAAIPSAAELNCCESGSTLRFLLPIAGALGVDACFRTEGRLAQRPLSPLWEEMERMGCSLSRPDPCTIRCTGQLQSGEFRIAGNVSSQFITGLLFACALMPGSSEIQITGKLESQPYVEMTLQALSRFGLRYHKLQTPKQKLLHSPGTVRVEGDWSNAAFFLAAKALGSAVEVSGLEPDSAQGDRTVSALLPKLKNRCCIDAADIPDLVPVLAVAAAANEGAVFTNIQRLRLKESDRVASVISMLRALGGEAFATKDTLTVQPTLLTGGTVDSVNDHRIAMSAAVAATVCTGPVTILGAQCVAKSYPGFWAEYKRLGGQYEQHIR